MLEYSEDFISKMWECVTIIEAQEHLKSLTVMDWPNMKKAQRQKIHRDMYKKAYPNEISQKNYVSVEDLQRIVGR